MPRRVPRTATRPCRASCSAARSSRRRTSARTSRAAARSPSRSQTNGTRAVRAPGPTAHVNQYFAIVLDNVVISAPVINEPIPGGNVQISSGGLGGFSRAGGRRARQRPAVRLAALPGRGAGERHDRPDARPGVPEQQPPRRRDRDLPRDPVHAHPLPAARASSRASRSCTTPSSSSRCSGSSRSR